MKFTFDIIISMTEITEHQWGELTLSSRYNDHILGDDMIYIMILECDSVVEW